MSSKSTKKKKKKSDSAAKPELDATGSVSGDPEKKSGKNVENTVNIF